MARILIVQGHPDSTDNHFGHALAEAYADGAAQAGHEVRTIAPARLDIPLLRSKAEWEAQPRSPALQQAQMDIVWAQHLLIVYPLWLGSMPALLKGFFEQVLRPGLAFDIQPDGRWKKKLGGRSARIIVTMGMPALVFRWFYLAHSLRSLERNILAFVGIFPVRHSIVGSVETVTPRHRLAWLNRVRDLGRKAA